MSNMRIITGSTGTTHVTSQDDRSLNACIYSQDNVVFNIGSKFAHTVVDNNTIIIADGDLLLQGCHARIDYNLSEEVAIDTGALGMKRVDFICARYSIDTSTGYESVNLHVVKGTASASEYVDPEVEDGLLREGAQTVDFPLYRVKLNGINIEDVEQLFTPQSSLNSNLTQLKTNSNIEYVEDVLIDTTSLIAQRQYEIEGNFNDYDIICFEYGAVADTSFLTSHNVPKTVFKRTTSTKVYGLYGFSGNYIEIYFADNTHFGVRTISGYNQVRIYGIKYKLNLV